jgi:hypothetical protein
MAESMRTTEDPTTNERGDEIHPAYALIGASRVNSTGTTLFDSEIVHNHFVRIQISSATRKRHLLRDWIHPDKLFISVDLSEAQWASFVSSMNVGSGVSCTLEYFNGETMPEFPHNSRLAQSIEETKDAADRAYEHIKKSMAAYESLIEGNAGARLKREALRDLHFAIENASSNVEFAGKSLVEATENVVQKARADVEAFVVNKARQLGIEASDIGTPLAIGVAQRMSRCSMCGKTRPSDPSDSTFRSYPGEEFDSAWDGCKQGSGT